MGDVYCAGALATSRNLADRQKKWKRNRKKVKKKIKRRIKTPFFSLYKDNHKVKNKSRWLNNVVHNNKNKIK